MEKVMEEERLERPRHGIFLMITLPQQSWSSDDDDDDDDDDDVRSTELPITAEKATAERISDGFVLSKFYDALKGKTLEVALPKEFYEPAGVLWYSCGGGYLVTVAPSNKWQIRLINILECKVRDDDIPCLNPRKFFVKCLKHEAKTIMRGGRVDDINMLCWEYEEDLDELMDVVADHGTSIIKKFVLLTSSLLLAIFIPGLNHPRWSPSFQGALLSLKEGKKKWVALRHRTAFQDAVFYKDKLCVIDEWAHVSVFKLDNLNGDFLFPWKEFAFTVDDGLLWNEKYLVGLGDKLVAVLQEGGQFRVDEVPGDTVDTDSDSSTKSNSSSSSSSTDLKHLYGRAVFVGDSASSFSAEITEDNMGAAKPDRIYFSDNYYKDRPSLPKKGAFDVGYYDLSTGSIHRHLPHSDMPDSPSAVPQWISL